MKPWVDRRNQLDQNPHYAKAARTHALVIGVSKYKWLPKPGDQAPDPRRVTLNLTQVDVPATSALLFARWLRDKFWNPAAPLATIRLCLSPSDEEIKKNLAFGEVDDSCKGATRQKVLENLTAWKHDCEKNPSGIAILYASGHGVRVLNSKEEAVILLEDFAEDPQVFTYSLDVGGVRKAMVGETKPQTQLYFADACRLPADTNLQGLGSGLTLPYDSSLPDRRSAPIFFSAMANTAALGVRAKGTFFMQALIDCLENRALQGPNRRSDLPLEQQYWHVSVQDLLTPWNTRVRELTKEKEKEIGGPLEEQGVTMGGEARPAVFHVLEYPPKVKLYLDLIPEEIAKLSKAVLWNAKHKQVVPKPLSCVPRPCSFGDVDAGLYSVDVYMPEPIGLRPGIIINAEPPETTLPWNAMS